MGVQSQGKEADAEVLAGSCTQLGSRAQPAFSSMRCLEDEGPHPFPRDVQMEDASKDHGLRFLEPQRFMEPVSPMASATAASVWRAEWVDLAACRQRARPGYTALA